MAIFNDASNLSRTYEIILSLLTNIIFIRDNVYFALSVSFAINDSINIRDLLYKPDRFCYVLLTNSVTTVELYIRICFFDVLWHNID